MSAHTPEHEELLMRIFSDEIEAEDPGARARLAECPDCREELERLRALAHGLLQTVAQERADIARARAETRAEDGELVRRSLRAALAEATGAAGRSHRARRAWLLALAAGVLLVLGWTASRWLHAPEAPEILLGGGAIECLTPRGAQAGEYPAFTWSFALPPQWSFELTIRSLENGQAGTELLRVPGLLEPRWEPDAEQLRALPDAIHWEVLAVDDTGGAPPATGWARASRRR